MKRSERQAINKRVVQNLPGLGFKGPLLFVNPIDKLLRGVFLDTSGFDTTSFYVDSFVQALCVPITHLALMFGGRIMSTSGVWDVRMPDLDGQLVAAIERNALPLLSRLSSLEAFIEHVDAGPRTGRTLEALGYAQVRVGAFDQAVATFEEIGRRDFDMSIEWQRELAGRIDALKSDVLAGPKAAQAHVIAIEAETINNLGLQKFWSGA